MIGAQKGTIFAGIFGNALEWYDFTAYAFFVPVLAGLFFPTHSQLESLLLAFSVFALSFLVRPFGAIFFGYIGDQFGRRNALIISIVIMSLPTFLLGLLPTYAAIGIAAPLLLTLLRLMQGIAVSGELTSATAFLVEHSHPSKRGLAGSLAMCSAFIGIVLSSAVVTLITETTTNEQLASWGWRLPFILGGLLGVLGIIIRLRSAETIHYQQIKQNPLEENRPSVIKHFVALNYRAVLIAIFITSIAAIANYMLIGFFTTFLTKNIGFSLKSAMLINFICLLVLTLLMPLMGIISDKIGRKPVLFTGVIGFIVLAHPIFWLLQQTDFVKAFAGSLLFISVLAPVVSLIPTTLAELFQTKNRNSGISLSYNISLALFGGTAPLIAITLVAKTQNFYAPAWYLMAAALLALLALLQLEESYQKKLA